MTQNVYFLLKNRLSSIAELDEIDWFTGQYEQNGEQALTVSTGCYLEFMSAQWQTLGDGQQQAALEFDVYLVQHSVLSGDERISDPVMDHLGIVDKIHKALHRWGAMLSDLPAFSALAGTEDDIVIINSIVRTGSTPDHNLSNLLVTAQRFSCLVRDISASPEYQETIANLNLNTEIDG